MTDERNMRKHTTLRLAMVLGFLLLIWLSYNARSCDTNHSEYNQCVKAFLSKASPKNKNGQQVLRACWPNLPAPILRQHQSSKPK